MIRVREVWRGFLSPGKSADHVPGDETGQVVVQSPQLQFVRPGDAVEAIGYPYVSGIQQCLRGGLYRLSQNRGYQTTLEFRLHIAAPAALAARVQELDRSEVLHHHSVNIQGVITWSHPSTPFIYVMDASGGVRVMNPAWHGADSQRPGSIVSVRGEVAEGDFVPVITNAEVIRSSYWNIAPGPLVSLDQALTGAEGGRWLQMRGRGRSVTHTHR